MILAIIFAAFLMKANLDASAAVTTHGTSSSSVYQTPLLRQAYWESYFEFHPKDTCGMEEVSYWKKPDFGLLLTGKYDVLTIAFADPDIERCHRKSLFCPYAQIVCGIELYDDAVGQAVFQDFKAAIGSAQKNGTMIKLAFGGEEFGNIRVPYGITRTADRVVDHIAEAAEALGVDGVDLVQAEGCGQSNFRCGDATATHLYVLEGLRQRLGPDAHLSYTFPSGRHGINFPFKNVLKFGHGFLDSVTLYGSAQTHKQVQEAITETDIPLRKISWGFPVGCTYSQEGNLVGKSEVQEIADKAESMGIGGLSMWSANRIQDC